MTRVKKKSFAFVAVAAASAAAALVGTGLVKDAQFAHARDNVEDARQKLAAAVDGGALGAAGGVFRNVGKVMEPSVVSISVRKEAKTGRRALPFDDEALKRFFPDRDGDGEPDLPEGFGNGGPDGGPESQGTGSGVIVDVVGGSGFIVTNNHVAGGATEIEVTLADGRVIKNGKLLGTDAKTDVAVIEVKADRLIPAHWGDSDGLERGDYVMAFGSPFGYIGSMTHGIVSALNRQAGILADRNGYESFIQVDCPINPGNSGGPLTNLKGEVVGINTAIATKTGSFSGIGFAIPSNQAKYVYQQLRGSGKVVRGWLGVGISDVGRDVDMARSFGFQGDHGVLVGQTFPNTPAYGKLKRGDIVTEIDGKPVETMQALRNTVAVTKPNAELKMKVFRDKAFTEVAVKVGEQPDDLTAVAGGTGNRPGVRPNGKADAKDKSPAEAWGLRLTDPRERPNALNADANTPGAVVAQVAPKSAAAKAGLRPGDVVTEVNGIEVATAKEAADALAKVEAGKDVRLYVTSAIGGPQYRLLKAADANAKTAE
jgi:serine protease Do